MNKDFVIQTAIFVLHTMVMQRLYCFLILLFSSSGAFAHAYFFAFAEMEYRADSKRFEITIEASWHDLDDVLKKSGIAVDPTTCMKDSLSRHALAQFVTGGFSVLSEQAPVALGLVGFEVLPNGLAYFYLLSEPVELSSSLHIRFDLLMDVFPEQQNKITLISDRTKTTAVFLPHQRTATITL